MVHTITRKYLGEDGAALAFAHRCFGQDALSGAAVAVDSTLELHDMPAIPPPGDRQERAILPRAGGGRRRIRRGIEATDHRSRVEMHRHHAAYGTTPGCRRRDPFAASRH